ncbi:MAG: dTDP-4-dehydrorhamnose reductase [Thermodesulfobacteriota bacterium]
MKLLIIGSKGQLGYDLVRYSKHLGIDVEAADLPEIDITRPRSVEKWVALARPSILINAAAYTNVDKAESEPALADAVNSTGPAYIARECERFGIPFLHISTDYVFNGRNQIPYKESDPIEPLGAYGKSKADGERHIRESLKTHIIVRTSWLYGAHGHNFVKTMLRLGKEKPVLRVVSDQFGCPTCAADLAETLLKIAQQIQGGHRLEWGTYHYCNFGIISWHQFATTIFELAIPFMALAVNRVEPISTEEYPTPVTRPKFSALDCTRIQNSFGIRLKPWRESLQQTIPEIINELQRTP